MLCQPMLRRLPLSIGTALVGMTLMLGVPAAASAATPTVVTWDITSTGATTASVDGSIEPVGQSTTYAVQYDLASATWCASGGVSGSPTHQTAAADLGSSDYNDHVVSVDLSGLTTGTKYCAQLVATNGSGQGQGGQLNWTEGAPIADALFVLPLNVFDSEIIGDINVAGQTTTYAVEYGLANSTWCTSGGSSGSPASTTSGQILSPTDNPRVRADVYGLVGGTHYCGRLIASNGSGSATSEQLEWTQDAPTATTFDAGSTGASTARLDGRILQGDAISSYQAQYDLASSTWCMTGGASGSPAHTTALQDLPSLNNADVSVDLTSLTAGTSYCAQLLASDGYGTSAGGQLTWTQGVPSVDTFDGFSTGPTTATVEGDVNPMEQSATYQVAYGVASSSWCTSRGMSGSPASTTGAGSLGFSDNTFHDVSLGLTGLTEGTTYCAVLASTNAAGTATGLQVQWTQGAPTVDTFDAFATAATSATVEGDVNPAGTSTSYQVQFNVASSEWCESDGASGSPASTGTISLGVTDGAFHDVSVDLSALSPGASYCGQLVATNSDGAGDGGLVAWTQPPPPPPPVALTVHVQGAGTVTSSPAGINCSTSTCSASFAPGTKVTLTASGGSFLNWLGLCLGAAQTSPTCTVQVDSNMVVTANFAFVVTPPRVLTVSRNGSGTGAVTSSPTAIRCGSVCSSQFPAGSRVTLTAFGDTGSAFAGWSGGGCSGTGTCTVTMTADQTVTATFNHVLAVASCKVPKLKGKKLAAAKTAIRNAHCAVGRITKAFSARVKKGRVSSQKPAPGSKHPAGTKIRLVVSKGRRPA